MKPRARRIVQIVAVAALLGVVIAGAGGWYLLGEERRTGRIVAGVLSGRLGVPITVERAGHTFALELTGEKPTSGLTLTLALLDAGARALRLTTQSTGSADDVVATRIDFAADPSRLTGLWPASLPKSTVLTGSGEVRLARGGSMTASARLTAGDTTTAPVIELTSHWDPAKVELVVTRYAFDSGRDVHLEGAATLPADGRPLSGRVEGTIDGSARSEERRVG